MRNSKIKLAVISVIGLAAVGMSLSSLAATYTGSFSSVTGKKNTDTGITFTCKDTSAPITATYYCKPNATIGVSISKSYQAYCLGPVGVSYHAHLSFSSYDVHANKYDMDSSDLGMFSKTKGSGTRHITLTQMECTPSN